MHICLQGYNTQVNNGRWNLRTLSIKRLKNNHIYKNVTQFLTKVKFPRPKSFTGINEVKKLPTLRPTPDTLTSNQTKPNLCS